MLKIATAFSLAVGLLTAPALAVPTAVAHSKVVVFNAKSMKVTARQTGYCWVSSIASQRSDAYRCMVGNAIHDPCFTLTSKSVACPASDDARSGILISLTKPLPQDTMRYTVWRMQLTNGAQCNIATGTRDPDYPFYCSGGLSCSAPPAGQQHGAVFVKCVTFSNGKPGAPGSYLATTLYE